MKHIPHLLLAGPWQGEAISLSPSHWHHLTRVLRLDMHAPLTYTDGRGQVGEGTLTDHAIVRGAERRVPRPSELEVVVAPPTPRDRQRFLVEKLTELGVARLRWLATRHGVARVAGSSKIASWVAAAVEQSRGGWAMEVSAGLATWEDLVSPAVVCAPGGDGEPPEVASVVVGPEGGFAPGEIPGHLALWDLGPTVLRVETAALVAAARLLG